MMSLKRIAAGVGISLIFSSLAIGQSPRGTAPSRPARGMDRETARMNERITQLGREVDELKTLVHQLQAQLATQPAGAAAAAPAASPPAPVVSAAAPPASAGVVADLLHGFTVNGLLDGYYEYNTNGPIGRVNYLRAYDVSSNSFSLSQADLIVESAPDPASGKREGIRIDLQYGQATSTLQSFGPKSIGTSSRPTALTFFRSAADSRWTSANGRARWASKVTTTRIS